MSFGWKLFNPDENVRGHRIAVPEKIQLEVLSQSARRCALCFGLEGDFTEKAGQIAHLDKNPRNNELSNLAFLCLLHHDAFDSTRSQSKGYVRSEIARYRSDLHEAVAERLRKAEVAESLAELLEEQSQRLQEALSRFDSLSRSTSFLYAEIMLRFRALAEYAKLSEEDMKRAGEENNETVLDKDGWNFHIATTKLLGMPFGMMGLYGMSEEMVDLIEESKVFFGLWVRGRSSPSACREFEEYVDDYLDLDLGWIICGIRYTELPSGGYRSLLSFFHRFGTRLYEM